MHNLIPESSIRTPKASLDNKRKFGNQTFTHPGQITLPRMIDVAPGHVSEEIRVSVPGGANVGLAINRVLDNYGLPAGCGRIVGGVCERVQYHVIVHATEGVKPYVYGEPIVLSGQSMLIGATITIGRKDDSSRVLHCHGGFVDENGKAHGGHIILDGTVAGRDGLAVRLCIFDGVDMVVMPDPETTFDLLKPVVKL